MMTRLICAFLTLFGSEAFADVVPIRSGEHASFTRLVFTIKADAEWMVGKTAQGYGVVVEGASAYESSEVFDRIPRQRITSIQAGETPDQLNLVLGCECRVEAFLFRSDLLVIDVIDGVAQPGSPFELALVRDMPQEMDPAIAPAVILSKEQADTVELRAVEEFLDPFSALVEQREVLLELETSIGESLDRATSQGLLTVAPSVEEPRPTTSVTEDLVDAEISGIDDEQEALATSPGIRIQTSIDRDAQKERRLEVTTQTGLACWGNELVNLSEWGAADGFADQIGALWSGLTQEFDRTNPEAVEELARTYLFFGFGREAIQVLKIDGQQSKERTILKTIAQIIDGDPVIPPIPPQMIGCDNDVALWAFIGSPSRDLTAQPNRIAILRALRALPLHLQAHLGSTVANRFLEMGDVDTAEQALYVGERVESKPVALELASIAIEAERGKTDNARNQLEAMAVTNGRMTPQALLELIRLNSSKQIETPPEILILSAAMRFENSGLPIALDLAAAEIEAKVLAGDFQSSLSLLDEVEFGSESDTYGQLFDLLAAAATDRMPESEFLDLVEITKPELLAHATANAVASRLLEYGLPEVANNFLRAPAIGEDMAERRYLRAEAALQLEEFDSVDPILAGITTERADWLRNAVLARRSGYAATSPSEVTPEDEAWREGNWQVLSSSNDPLLADATALVLSDGQAVSSPETPLANTRSLLAETDQMRTVVEGLLSRYSLPDTSNEQIN